MREIKEHKHVTYVFECRPYFSELRKFLSWMPEDIYVNASGLTDIMVDYLLQGENNSLLFDQLRRVVDTTEFAAFDYFRDNFAVAFPGLYTPLKEAIMKNFLHLMKDFYYLEHVLLVKTTNTIAIRLRSNETTDYIPKFSHPSYYQRDH